MQKLRLIERVYESYYRQECLGLCAMNIKQGYKQTEIGIIPEDWEVKLVQEISDVKSGKRLPLGKSLLDDETPHPYIKSDGYVCRWDFFG
jgi:hypothetical protein